jgi:putative cell wall-binding protein
LTLASVGGTVMGGTFLLGAAPAGATTNFAFTRTSGPTRYDTAAALATSGFASAPTVLLSTGQNFPDALAGNYLAGAYDAPILLSSTKAPVPTATMSALATLKTKTVFVLGGTNAIGNDVVAQISATASTNGAGGNIVVQRIQGPTRYDTMKALVETPPPAGIGLVNGKRTAIIASGGNFPDALAVGPISWNRQLPTILTDPSTLVPQASGALADLSIQQVLIAGGPAAIPPPVEAQINSLGITTLARFNGLDRSDTARQAAEYAIANLGFSAAALDVATGAQAFGGADALAGGAFAGHQVPGPVPVLVTNTSVDAGQATTFAMTHAGTLATGVILGGIGPLPDSTMAPITQAARTPSNATYPTTVGTTNDVRPVGTTRAFTFTNLGSTSVDIRLIACGDTQSADNIHRFTGSNPGGGGNVASFPTPVAATLTTVNGTAIVSAGFDDNVVPQNAAVTLTMTDNTAECAVPVVYSRADGNDVLELAADGSPFEDFGLGGTTVFTPPTAAAGLFPTPGAPASAATFVDTVNQYFIAQAGTDANGAGGAPATFWYKSTDSFLMFNGQTSQCTIDNFIDFQGRLTVGDTLSGTFNPNGKSTFCLDDQAPALPNSPTVSAGSQGVTVSWFDSGTPSVASYFVYRAPAVAIAANGSTPAGWGCPALAAPVSPLQGPVWPYARVVGIADKSANGAPETQYGYVDSSVAANAVYCYAVASVDNAGELGAGALATSNAPGPNAVQAQAVTGAPPSFVNAVVATGSTTVSVVYNEAINCNSVDGDSSDYVAALVRNGASTPDAFAAVVPQCSDNATNASGVAGVGQVTLTLTTAPATGDSVTITARAGGDHNTVVDMSGLAQAAGNTVASPPAR